MDHGREKRGKRRRVGRERRRRERGEAALGGDERGERVWKES